MKNEKNNQTVKKNRSGITPRLMQSLIDHFGQFPYNRPISAIKPNFSNEDLKRVQDNLKLEGPNANAIFWISSYVTSVASEYGNSKISLNGSKSEVKNLQRLKRAKLNDECGFVLRLRFKGKLTSIPINELTLRNQLLQVVDAYRSSHLEIHLNTNKSTSMLESKITTILCNLIFRFLQQQKANFRFQSELSDTELYCLTGYILLCSNWQIRENKFEDKKRGYRQHRVSSAIKFDPKFRKTLTDKVRNRILSIEKKKSTKTS